jgi:hypothetical protein
VVNKMSTLFIFWFFETAYPIAFYDHSKWHKIFGENRTNVPILTNFLKFFFQI